MKTTIDIHGTIVVVELVSMKFTWSKKDAILAFCDDGFLGCMTSLGGAFLPEGHVIVNENSLYEDWVPQVLANLPQHFIDTGRTVKCGFNDCRVFKFIPWE